MDISDRRIVCDPASIPLSYDVKRSLYGTYTADSDEYELSNRTLRNRAAYGAGGYRNPYSKAKALYDFLVNRISWQAEEAGGTALDVVDGRKGNALDYARALTALFRSQGLPAREVRGILIDRAADTVRPHAWVEVYFERVGWFPCDPALADGAWERADYERDYYWGGLTSGHLAFSRGEVDCGVLDDRTVRVKWEASYSDQTVHEEKMGNISYYRSRWILPEIVDIAYPKEEIISFD